MNSLISRNSLFDDFFRDFAPGFFIKPLHGENALPSPAQIRIDVKENDQSFIVQAEVPGVRKDDIQVSLDGSVVTLRAEVKQQDNQTEGDKVLRSERYYGTVSRSFSLDQDIDTSKVQAKYADGVLNLELPKKAPADSRKIAIQ